MRGRGRNQREQGRKTEFKATQQGGECICPQCGYSSTHRRGVPCTSLLCPTCQVPLKRQNFSQTTRNNVKKNSSNDNNCTVPKVNTELCIGCGACVKKCPANAIVMEDGKAKIISEKCKNCRICISVCKVEAIS